jgi:transposase
VPEVLRLMTHPGVGFLTALAFALIIRTPERFKCGKQIGSYVGLIPAEDSSAGHQRLGHISKQGRALLSFLLVEAADVGPKFLPHSRGSCQKGGQSWVERLANWVQSGTA